MRYDAEHKLKTRQRVLKAATRAILADGPHRVGVAAVMNKAGLTHGGFYAHFASKDELVTAAISQMFDNAERRIAKETANRSPAEGVAAYIDFYLSPGHRDGQSTGCPMPTLAADVPRLPLGSRREFATGVQRLTQALGQHLAALGGTEVEPLADSVLCELVGALSIARTEPDRARSDAILAASRRALKQRLQLTSAQ